MKLIRIKHPHGLNQEDLPPLSMALGYFDGVHIGHQKVMMTAKKIAAEKGLKSAIMTFDPHPSVILGNVKQVEYITPLEEKIKAVEKLEIDFFIIVQFTREFANLLPQEFIDEYIIGLNVKQVIAGFDYTYGKMGKGTMETIQFHSRGKFDFTVVPKFTLDGEKISSTRIRYHLRNGEMDKLSLLLGRYYTTNGVIVHGDKRGRTIGFPTANVKVSDDYLLPPTGVYATRICIKGTWYDGVCNLGYKPTFVKALVKPSIEVHIFEFAKDIYGESVIVEWHKKIRDEQKFLGVAELVQQIEKDKEEAVRYFEKNLS